MTNQDVTAHALVFASRTSSERARRVYALLIRELEVLPEFESSLRTPRNH